MEQFLKQKQEELDVQIEKLVTQKVVIDSLLAEYNAIKSDEEEVVEEVTEPAQNSESCQTCGGSVGISGSANNLYNVI